MDMIVRHAVVRGHQGLVDIVIEKDHIASVQPKAADEGRREIDAAGSLVLPGLFNLHFHADKCLLGEIMRPNLSGTLPEAIEITTTSSENMTLPKSPNGPCVYSKRG